MKNKFNFMREDVSPDKARKRQKLILILSFGGFILFCASIILFSEPKQKKVPFSLQDPKSKIKISDVTGGAKAEDRWLEEAETKLKKLDKLVEANDKQQAKITELQAELEEYKKNDDGLKDHKAIVDGYYDEMRKLEKRIADMESKKSASANTSHPQYPQAGSNQLNSSPFVTAGQQTPDAPAGIMNVDFKLDGEDVDTEYNAFDTIEYLPAGSYVSAVVISGVDASVGVSSQSDPRPVLFRINGNAKSALLDNESQEVDIRGCTVTGAASGDLSSEKVFVRLLKMTCSREDHKVIETEVKGYATAVGKAGIRGPVVSREGDLVVKSFFAGLAGGVGNGMAQSLTTPATIVGGVATQTPNAKDIAGQGLGKGLQSSADRLADYLIKRAEQYQPVITIPAGIDVELVFHEGVYLDGRSESAHKAKEKTK